MFRSFTRGIYYYHTAIVCFYYNSVFVTVSCALLSICFIFGSVVLLCFSVLKHKGQLRSLDVLLLCGHC